MKQVLYDWGGYNATIFYLINRYHGPFYDQFMLLGSALGKFTMFAVYFPVVVAIAYRDIRTSRYSAAKAPSRTLRRWFAVVATLLLAYLLMLAWVFLLKTWLNLPRPFAALPSGTVDIMPRVLRGEDPMVGFPSGHCAFTMLMAAGLWPILGKAAKAAACFFVAWAALSRIALGVHFPADVAWSLLLSFLAVLLVRAIVHSFTPLH